MAKKRKPRVYRAMGAWFCRGDGYCAFGDSPPHAYEQWRLLGRIMIT